MPLPSSLVLLQPLSFLWLSQAQPSSFLSESSHPTSLSLILTHSLPLQRALLNTCCLKGHLSPLHIPPLPPYSCQISLCFSSISKFPPKETQTFPSMAGVQRHENRDHFCLTRDPLPQQPLLQHLAVASTQHALTEWMNEYPE